MVNLLRKYRNVIKELEKVKVVAPRDLRIIEAYESLQIDSQMDKYETLATNFKLNADTIRKIIRNMKK